MKKTILIVFGTRPEAIKLAPVITAIQSRVNQFNLKICVTGQHREMLDQVLEIFNIKPDYDLNIMKANQDLFDVTTNVLSGLKTVIDKSNPEIIIVHGDTTTSMVAALAAFYRRITVAHVEAGLRTGDIYSPWPEEMNRKITGQLSSIHFAPTQNSKINLINENITQDQIFVTGNTGIDSVLYIKNILCSNRRLENEVIAAIKKAGYPYHPDRKMILVTGHRRENHGVKIRNVFGALKSIAIENPDLDIVYPVHLNPKIKTPADKILGLVKNIYLIKPVDYLLMVKLMDISYIILTDSGGIQEEAPSLGKPTLVLRDTTERPEALEAGLLKIVGTNHNKIVESTNTLLRDKEIYNSMISEHNPYGDGKASEKIADILGDFLNS
jgi:UDP-N-acetylglucosamine 2-epimerase (non-hydrolysing)